MKKNIFELCKGRHSTPADKAIFSNEINPFDFVGMEKACKETLGHIQPCDVVELYVTGLTPALVTVINYCLENGINLKLYHFNRDTNDYVSQWITGTINEWLK